MTPMKDVRLALGELIAADAATLAPVAPNEVELFTDNIAVDENLVYADLTFATFDGYAALATGAAPMLAGIDPVTGEQVVTLKEPAGGWRWESSGLTNLPQTIYGFALVNAAGNDLLAAALLDEPITITEVGQFIDLGACTFRFVAEPMS